MAATLSYTEGGAAANFGAGVPPWIPRSTERAGSTTLIGPLDGRGRGADDRTGASRAARDANSDTWDRQAVAGTPQALAMDQVHVELEVGRVAILSLLAVITDEQFRAVETALEALGAMSETASAALNQLRLARRQQPPFDRKGSEVRRAFDAAGNA